MFQKLSKLQQQGLAIGLLLAVIALILILVIWPWYAEISSAKKQISDLSFRIQRYSRIIASENEVFEKVAGSKQMITDLGYFNDQGTPALASADLQAFIKNTIVSAGGVLESTQVIPQTEETDLTRIAVNVRLTGDVPMLRTVLYQIETAKPLKIIEELDVRPIRGIRNHTSGKLEDMGTLSINIQVASFLRKSE